MFIREIWGKFPSFIFSNFPLKHVITSTDLNYKKVQKYKIERNEKQLSLELVAALCNRYRFSLKMVFFKLSKICQTNAFLDKYVA